MTNACKPVSDQTCATCTETIQECSPQFSQEALDKHKEFMAGLPKPERVVKHLGNSISVRFMNR